MGLKSWRECRCEWCTASFWAVRSDARFCSARCRSAAHRKRVKTASVEDGAFLDEMPAHVGRACERLVADFVVAVNAIAAVHGRAAASAAVMAAWYAALLQVDERFPAGEKVEES